MSQSTRKPGRTQEPQVEINLSQSPETELRLIGAMSGARSDAQEIIEKTEFRDMATQQGQTVRDAVEDLLKSADDFGMIEIAANIKARGHEKLVSFDTLSKCRIEYRIACDAAGSPEKAVEELLATLKRCRVRRDMENALFEAFKATRDGKPTADITEAIERAQEAVSRSLQPKGEPRFKRIKLRETFNRARLEYLIQGIFLEIGTGVVTNTYGGFKSFVFGVDLGLCVATGKDFFGRAVKRGPVVYILAEGAYETEARAKAWLQYHGISEIPDNFEIIEMPVQIADATQRAAFINDLREMSPALVILDTLAKCNLGSDENDARDMGLFTNGMEVIARELGAFVLAIHHNNKGGTARGSVSLPANVDASIVLKSSPGRVVTVECDRVKGAPFEPFSLIGRVVTLPELDTRGNSITSLVFEATDTPETPSAPVNAREKMIEILRDADDGLTTPEWLQIAVSNGIAQSSFYRLKSELKGSWTQAGTGRIKAVSGPKVDSQA